MQYFGGKFYISGPLTKFLNSVLRPNQPFVDLFCGSCNVVTKIDAARLRIANDINPYLIEMWKSLQAGWIPPQNLTKDEYYKVKSDLERDKALSSFVGFGCSFTGKWWGGYATSPSSNYCKNAYNSQEKLVFS